MLFMFYIMLHKHALEGDDVSFMLYDVNKAKFSMLTS